MIRVLILLLPLAACVDLPELDDTSATAARNRPWPQLVPLAPVLASARDLSSQPDAGGALTGRAARLKAKAAALQGEVIDDETRRRMEAAGAS